MFEIVVPVIFWVLPVAAAAASLADKEASSVTGIPRPKVHVITLWCLVAVPSLLQLFYPELYGMLRRDWALIMEGQVWRLVSSLVVQDGGIAGTLFNLLTLAIVALGAQSCWTPARTWATFWVGGIVANCFVGPSLNPVGAGNSMATFTVAVALAVSVLRDRPSPRARVWAVGGLACTAFILLARDYHGWTLPIGAAAGFLPSRRRREVRT